MGRRFRNGGPVNFGDDHHDCAAKLRVSHDTMRWLIDHGITNDAVVQVEALLRAQIDAYDLSRWEQEVSRR